MIWVDGIVPMFCGQAMVTERWAERGGREGGSVSVGTFHSPVLLGDFPLTLLLSCHLTTLLPYYLTTLQPYNLTTLPPYHLTTLQPYHLTTLQPYHFTTLLPDHPTTKRKSVSERKDQWVLSSPAWQQVTMCCSYVTTWSPLRFCWGLPPVPYSGPFNLLLWWLQRICRAGLQKRADSAG